MTIQTTTLLFQSTRCILRLGLLGALTAAGPLLAAGTGAGGSEQEQAASSTLVQTVRQATERFVDVNAATAAGYAPAFGCVTGPDMGAMGVHYINNALVSGGQLNASEPQALIYEPAGKAMKLVGVEYITLAENWLTAHQQAPPVLDGQLLQYIGTPNRYGLPGLFELHVWAWRDNPHGAFVDWNTHVSCENE
ncbi:MAG: hypothetical protein ABSC65_11160 [Acidobacteriaceae bacterium]|jgi:hypothetical protein